MRRPSHPAAALAMLAALACESGRPQPAPLDTRNEACASCRMAVSDARFAAQLVAPGEEPRFFDDIGCLATFVKAGRAPAGATAFVTDYRTRDWIRADRAVYARVPGLQTPMGSQLVAHADAATPTGTPVALSELFGPAGPPAGVAR